MSAPVASDAPKASDIRAMRWISPDADAASALTMRPGPCQRVPLTSPGVVGPEGVARMTQTEIGRLAFESPALLGGAAGRMGLSCSSCHLNGRNNPAFFVEGVSGAAGTADVTSSIFSKTRGNGKVDPVPIPDLAARDGHQIKDRKSPEFRAKVHGLVVEEFDGQEPPVAVADDLLIYLDALTLEGCEPAAQAPVLAAQDAADARKALFFAQGFAEKGDREAALLMARVSRTVLERLDERFVAADQGEVRDALVLASREIGVWAEGVRAGRVGAAPLAAVDVAGELVNRNASRSLYNPQLLKAALAK